MLLDRWSIDDPRWTRADLARHPGLRRWWPAAWGPPWPAAFDGADVVLHLGAEGRPSASWWRVRRDNVRATRNVLAAATARRVPRVVFASSTWATQALEDRLAPGCYRPDGPKIDSNTPADPKTAYGASKAAGERMGQALVEAGRLRSFVAVRIGWCSPDGGPPPPERDPHTLWVRWIGRTDLAALLRRCVEAEYDGFHVAYGVSAQRESPFDLSHTRRLLGWAPLQHP